MTLPTVSLRGTVKLHGCNCAVLMCNGLHSVQSRNRFITKEHDMKVLPQKETKQQQRNERTHTHSTRTTSYARAKYTYHGHRVFTSLCKNAREHFAAWRKFCDRRNNCDQTHSSELLVNGPPPRLITCYNPLLLLYIYTYY